MSKIVSHANCTHESSKAARAKCRRSRDKMAEAFAAVLGETAGIAVETPAPVFESVNVTRENWRDHADSPVVLFTRISDDEEAPIAEGVKITGWGKQWVNYVNDEGKTKRTAVTCLGARTIEA
jgi:hypothetical protein